MKHHACLIRLNGLAGISSSLLSLGSVAKKLLGFFDDIDLPWFFLFLVLLH
jgi:hypothetical protein